MMNDENWRLEMRKTIEGCIARLDEMMAQWKKDDVNGIKQELKKMTSGNSETQENDANVVVKETEIVDETKIEKEAKYGIEEVKAEVGIKTDAQASMNTKTKVVILKSQFKLKNLPNLKKRENCRKGWMVTTSIPWYNNSIKTKPITMR